MGYSDGQIKFILEHYMELASSNMPIDKAKEHLKSSRHRNPDEIFVIWKADIDKAISSLCPEHDHWHLVAKEITPSMLLHISRSKNLSRMQRDIVSLCIIRDCHAEDCKRAIYCDNQGIITRMRKFLNGKFTNNRYTEQKEKPLIIQVVQ